MNKLKSFLAKTFEILYFFYQYLRGKIFILLIFSFLMAVMDSIGLTLFVPLLAIADSNDSKQPRQNNKITEFVQNLFDMLHLELNVVSLLILIVLVFLIKAVFFYYAIKYHKVTLQQLARDLRKEISYGLQRLTYKEFVKADVGRLQNSMGGESYQVANACSQYLDAIKYGMIVGVYLIFAFIINWQFSILVMIGGLISNFVYKRFYKRTKYLSRKVTKNNHVYGGLVIEVINHFKYLKATGRNKKFTNNMVSELDDLTKNNIEAGRLNALLAAMREPMMILIICTVIALHLLIFKSPLSAVIIILVLFYRALTSIMALQTSWNNYLAATGSLENIRDLKTYLNQNQELWSGSKQLEKFESLELDNVSLQYNSYKVLKDISLTIHRNETVAFVGESGSGKTTLVNLLCSLLYASQGEVLVNGEPLQAYNIDTYKDKIGYVSQEPTIFNGSIFDNISFWGERSIESLEKFWKVVEMCSLLSFVQGLPEKENTILGNNGLNISGGQKQRVSIARELFRDIELLILDEATAALDSETERLIQESMLSLQGKFTIISIAHRLSTIQSADKIFLMEKGQVVESGTFQELKAKSGYFANLSRLQGL